MSVSQKAQQAKPRRGDISVLATNCSNQSEFTILHLRAMGTYTQIHLQFVFAVKYRNASIHPSWKNELYKYITGIVQNHGHKMICINGMPDHIHILVGMRANQSVSDLLREIKSHSSKWINERNLVVGKFEWQEGYGAFSYSRSALKNVINYIEQQEGHHKTVPFKMEYISFLKENEIEYDERFVFHEQK